ncbi:MAG: 3-deoxy-manno-octulosonate cytidylyltransferase [Chitinivibrionales bacterium]|nr:3-deoxy-manno-octulosonate cytidylyltransferase [Chitinivibrionales bacterium]
MSSTTVCVIPARYGSTRLPGKPLIEIAGVPMVMWVYRAAADSGVFDEVLVATDDERIARAIEGHGGRARMTSADHERGSDRVFEAIRDSTHTYIVNLQGDEPQVPPVLLRQFVETLHKAVDDNALLTGVSRVSRDEIENPNVVKVVLARDNRALYFSRAPIPYDHGATDTFVKHTGIYGFTRKGLARYCGFGPGQLERLEKLEQLRALENGMDIHCLFHDHRLHGIDTPADLEAFRAFVAAGEGR